MIKKIVFSVLLLSLSACQTTGDIAANYSLSEQVSPGGLPYTNINMPGNPRITIQVAWPSTWAYSANRNPIVPRVGTRLIFAGGATGYPAGETLERINDIGTEGDLWPAADYVFGVLHYSPKHQEETLQIANAHVENPALDEKWFARVRDQLAGQMNEARAAPRQQGFQALRWATLLDTPLRDAVSIPDANAFESVKLSEIRQWAKSVFKRNGAIVAVAGDISAADAGYVVDKLFEGLPEGETTPMGSSKASFSAKRILLHAPQSPTSTLSFFGKLPPASDGSILQDRLIADGLSGGFDSGLAGAVRTELRAAYSYGAGVDEISNEHRMIVFSGEVETAKIAEAEQAVLKAYSEFLANPQFKKLADLKKPYETGLKQDLKDTGSVAYDAVISKIYGMDSSRALKLIEEIEAITDESIAERVSTAFPKAADMMVVVDSPDKNALPGACVITTPEAALDC